MFDRSIDDFIRAPTHPSYHMVVLACTPPVCVLGQLLTRFGKTTHRVHVASLSTQDQKLRQNCVPFHINLLLLVRSFGGMNTTTALHHDKVSKILSRYCTSYQEDHKTETWLLPKRNKRRGRTNKRTSINKQRETNKPWRALTTRR